MLLPLARLERVNGLICGDLLQCLATTDRLHDDSGLGLRTMGAAFAHGWEPPSQRRCPASKLTMGPAQENQTSSEIWYAVEEAVFENFL
jgi:hypothetical protein